MKKIGFLILLFLMQNVFANAQLIRRIKDELKVKAEQIVIDKMNKGIDKAIDSTLAKKKNKTKTGNQKQEEISQQVSETTATNSETEIEVKEKNEKKNNQSGEEEGFLELHLPVKKIFVGGILTITGQSIIYKEYNSVEIKITGKNYNENKTVKLDAAGKYRLLWNVPDKAGVYTILAISSDKKVEREEKVTVQEIQELSGMANENIEQTNRAWKTVEERAEKIKGMIGKDQATELEKKLKDLKIKKDAAIKFFNSINDANKKATQLAKKSGTFPRNLSQNLSELNQHFKTQADDMKRMQEFTDHEPADNSICEYLVMVNEALAAFSTFSAFWEKSAEAIITNIVLDKVPPFAVGHANNIVGKPIPEPTDFIPKETSKLFATALVDLESLKTIKGKAGIAGDLVTFISNVLMKNFCGVYKGEMKHNYIMTFFNKDKKIYWRYGVEMKAMVNLRYPKNSNTGRIIKMKGSFEGNATAFSFFADPKEAMAEELKASGRYNMVETFTLRDITPVAVPFSVAQEDVFSFGAITRSAFTPASFYIPIDAEYNLDNHQIKIFINPAILDFTPYVRNTQIYLIVAIAPMFRLGNYPIEKAEKTIRGSLKEKNYFIMTGEAEGKPKFEGTIKRKISDPEFEIDLRIFIKAVKD
jgi:hypothetical protein